MDNHQVIILLLNMQEIVRVQRQLFGRHNKWVTVAAFNLDIDHVIDNLARAEPITCAQHQTTATLNVSRDRMHLRKLMSIGFGKS